jgi:2Fe-2S ferredoxin
MAMLLKPKMGIAYVTLCLKNHIEIEHACDKVCACTTCHVIIREGFDTLPPSDDLEDDMLDKAWGLSPKSRLSCQSIIQNDDITIEIPKYTINLAKE